LKRAKDRQEEPLDWIHIYAVAFMMAAVAALALTPACQRLAAMTGFMDMPKRQGHNLHAKATPLLGGLAIYGAWAFTVLGGFAASGNLHLNGMDRSVAESLSGVHVVGKEFLAIFLCASAAVALGLVDDRYTLKASTKLFVQMAIAVATVTFGGVRISAFINSGILTWGLSVLWILVIFSAINFFDNMDGLVAGTATIAFTFFTLAAAANQQFFVASLGAACAGASLGFWFFNHSPASIFMGDAGSHFTGYMLAVISAKVTYYTPGVSTTHLPVLIPLFILAIPLFDAFAVTAIRLYNGKAIYVGDHNHISHRFLHMGMSRKMAVLMVHLTVIVSGLGALPLLWGDEKTCGVLMVQGVAFLLLISLLQYAVRLKPAEAGKEAPQEAEPPQAKGEGEAK